MMMLSVQEIITRLVIAAVLGCAVGIERERLNWVAGMRTHMLVCLGSALIMMVSMFGFTDALGHRDVSLDPSRVAAQVVSGIGFLGAGTIFFWKKEIIRGLTTAAALWAVAGVGLAIGGGMYIAGGVATLLILIILAAMKPVEKMIFKNEELLRHTLLIRIHQGDLTLRQLREQLEADGVKVIEMKSSQSGKSDSKGYLVEIYITGEGDKLLDFADKISRQEGVEAVTYN